MKNTVLIGNALMAFSLSTVASAADTYMLYDMSDTGVGNTAISVCENARCVSLPGAGAVDEAILRKYGLADLAFNHIRAVEGVRENGAGVVIPLGLGKDLFEAGQARLEESVSGTNPGHSKRLLKLGVYENP